MPEYEYVNIKMVKELADLIDQLIEEGKMGYRSRGEFCHAAVRRLVEHYWEILGRPLQGEHRETKPKTV